MENIQIKKIIYFGIVFYKIIRITYWSENDGSLQRITGINDKFYLFGFLKVKEIAKIC